MIHIPAALPHFLLLITLALMPSLVFAHDPPTYTLQLNATPGPLDARNPTVALEALKASTIGHAFMVIKVRTAHGYKEEAFGFYPASNATLGDKARLIIGTPGALRSEFQRSPPPFSRIAESLEVPISSAQRSLIYKTMTEWNNHDYKLTVDNCIAFVDTIVRKIGLPAPPRRPLQTPTEYLRALKDQCQAQVRRQEVMSRPPAGRWTLTLFNVDDVLTATLNGREILKVTYQRTNSVDFSNLLTAGINSIDLSLLNYGGPWTYGYLIAKDGVPVYSEQCGVVAPGQGGSTACTDNRTGIVLTAHCAIAPDTSPPVRPCDHR